MSLTRCSRTSCAWPATHTIDTRRPPYAGPALVCTEHAHAAMDALEHGQGLTVGALPREDHE